MADISSYDLDGNIYMSKDFEARNAIANLSNVANSGDYNDLINKPQLGTVAISNDYDDLTNKPQLKAVAISGDYNDLINKPSLIASLENLNDVNLNNLVDGQVLTYDTALGQWINKESSGGGGISLLIVDVLPTVDINPQCIYLVPNDNPSFQDSYLEFLYVNNNWEQIGIKEINDLIISNKTTYSSEKIYDLFRSVLLDYQIKEINEGKDSDFELIELLDIINGEVV